MKTVKEISSLTGISVRTLHHYDAIGLLKPTDVTQAGYRLYDDAALERLYLILLFRELGFALKQIRQILDAPDFDRNRILERQIELLQQKVRHLENRIELARGIKLIGVRFLEMEGFDPNQIDDYAQQAKTLYGKTEAYREYTQKSTGRTKQQEHALGEQVMDFFVRLGAMRHEDPASAPVQAWVRELQSFFTEHYYTCTPQILRGLSEGYGGGGSMNENIDAAGGEGTGEFARRAIEIYTK
ncbi:MAG: MerR family transcriptional regulator [Oscillospiraceae bacterium]|nr:MerR family transcriptional regulator [Oscillospiraceae bacterium]